MSRSSQPRGLGTRVVLIAGFGGLLALMAAAGIDSLRALARIQSSNARIHRDFLSRERLLDQIQTSLYLSGTVVRDHLLLDPGQSAGEAMREELKQIRNDMEAALALYAKSLRPDERAPFYGLREEVGAYWSVLDPVFEWDARRKRDLSYWFIRTELFPRRATVLAIARDVAAVNQRTLRDGEQRVSELFAVFRRRLQVILGVALGLGLLVAVTSIVYILRLERSAGERYQESVRAQNQLKELSARLLEVQEQERRAISRELHDEIGQALSALLMDLGCGRLDSSKQLAENCVQAVRNMALLLRPSMLDDLGLVPALEWQAREVSKRTGLRVDVVDENVADNLPDGYRTCVYRVVQEALNNSSRHSAAHSVRIVLRQEPDRLLLTVQDDGRGFDPHRVRGLGLVGMGERVEHLGGAFHVQSEPGRGALLKIELPLQPETP